MTIVFLTPRFYPQIGGVEKHAFEVAKRLAKKHKVTIITESAKKDHKENLHGINIQRLYFGRNDWFKKFIIWKRILDKRKLIEKADIIHCHDVFFWYIPLRIIYPRKKVYVTFHGYETAFPPKMKAIFIRKFSEKLTNGNICIGDYIKKWYGTSPNIVIYGAVNKTKQRLQAKALKSSKLKILLIGRLENDVGVPIFLKSLEIMENKRINFEFEACGDGSLKKDVQRFGKVHGFVQNLTPYIRKADIIFVSSYLSIFEAFANRKPVFSVFSNKLKEDYLKMSPFKNWIIIEESPKILVNKIKLFMRNKKFKEKNINSSYNWVKNQTWKKVTNQYLKLWNI